MTPENQSSERANPEASALYQVPQWPRVIPCLDSSGFFNYTLLFLWWLNLGILSLKIPFFKHLFTYLCCVYYGRGVSMHLGTSVAIRGQRAGVHSLHPRWESWGSNSSPWSWRQAPVPAEPSCRAQMLFLSGQTSGMLSFQKGKKKCVSLGEYYHVTASSRLYLYSMNNPCYS